MASMKLQEMVLTSKHLTLGCAPKESLSYCYRNRESIQSLGILPLWYTMLAVFIYLISTLLQ